MKLTNLLTKQIEPSKFQKKNKWNKFFRGPNGQFIEGLDLYERIKEYYLESDTWTELSESLIPTNIKDDEDKAGMFKDVLMEKVLNIGPKILRILLQQNPDAIADTEKFTELMETKFAPLIEAWLKSNYNIDQPEKTWKPEIGKPRKWRSYKEI